MPPNNANIVDPAAPRYGLKGRIVTMDQGGTVLQGTVYVNGRDIVRVILDGGGMPADLQDAPVIDTGGTIYPGLIELHNHLSYNVLPLWDGVSTQYTNRDQWGGTPAYRQKISGPMSVLGTTQGYPEAVVRYVECKCLLGGVTTSQGVPLFSDSGIQSLYQGIVRNVEATGDPMLPPADGHIADVEALKRDKFFKRLQTGKHLILHLCEGTDKAARKHFTDLQFTDGSWAITPALTGIHCVALQAGDLQVLKGNGGSMVWSPFSNLMLYGQTADVGAAKAAGVKIAIGSDWSPSGSKNLLGEMKVARSYSAHNGNLFTDAEIVAMATRNAAEILQWSAALGSIEVGKRADLLVINNNTKDPYATLIEAHETDISLVAISGVPRYWQRSWTAHFGTGTEKVQVGSGQPQGVLNLKEESENPLVGNLTLHAATKRLKDGLHNLHDLALALERPRAHAQPPRLSLVLDQDQPGDMVLRTYFRNRLALERDRGVLLTLAPAPPLSQVLGSIDLDPLTVADDPTFLNNVRSQPNLPQYIKDDLAAL
jgi:5-methylthioadenosine/S-adenosylhomocysteine deaminase